MINSQMRCKRLLKKGTSTASTYILLTVTALICACLLYTSDAADD